MIINAKRLFLHLLNRHPQRFIRIILGKEGEKEIFKKIAAAGVKIERADAKKAQALARGGNHQGVLAEVEEFSFGDLASVKDDKFVPILYGLTDVGNIGAIMRSAYALGAGSVIVVANNLNMAGVVRASSGAAYELNVVKVADGLSVIKELKQSGFEIYAASADGTNLKELKLGAKNALVKGDEEEGIPARGLKKSDRAVAVKRAEGWDSLNVSAAFAILCDGILNGRNRREVK